MQIKTKFVSQQMFRGNMYISNLIRTITLKLLIGVNIFYEMLIRCGGEMIR